MKYKEKKFTKEQLRRIEIIRRNIAWLRNNDVVIEGSGYIEFSRTKNYTVASKEEMKREAKRDRMYNPNAVYGITVNKESIEIDGGGGEELLYPPDWEIE